MKQPRAQISKMSAKEVDVINIYRSQGTNNAELAENLKQLIDEKRLTIVCGDINLCFVNERGNKITTMLEHHGFKQMVMSASHLKGGHIDHVYSNHDPNIYTVDIMMYSPYYTSQDHDAFCITIIHSAVEKEKQVLKCCNLLNINFSFRGMRELELHPPLSSGSPCL